MTTSSEIGIGRPRLRREIGRWGLAAAIVVTGHVALAYGVATFAPVRESMAVQEAMTVELAPLVVSTAEPVETETVEEERPEILSELQEEPPAEVEETAEAEPEPEQTVKEEPEPVEEQPEQVVEDEPIEEIAPTPEVKKAEVVLPKPVKPRPVKKPEQKPKPVVKKEQPRKVTVAPKTQTRAARQSASRKAVVGAAAPRAPKVNPSRWYAQVQSAVVRRKPESLGQSGRVVIRFVVNSAGSIVSSGIARSSGHAVLDRAALSMARGARVPPPPPGLGGSTFPFTIPVVFR